MTQHKALRFAEHHNLRVKTDICQEYGDNRMSVPILPWEFWYAQTCFPILFSKNDDGESYTTVALMGLEQGQNLFLEEGKWKAVYHPAAMRMQPFLIGFANSDEMDSGANSQVHIDLSHPRVSTEAGELLFHENGSETQFLIDQAKLLGEVQAGLVNMKQFAMDMNQLGLIEPLRMKVELSNGSKNELTGFHTINEQRLSELVGLELELLHKKGFLRSAYLICASMVNMHDLIEKQNAISGPS